MTLIRDATTDDAHALVPLMDANVRALGGARWHGSAERLVADVLAGSAARLAVAARDERLVAFLAWTAAYDLHHCVRGGEVCDLYVDPDARGVGLATQLLAHACAQVARAGGVYIRGTATRGAVPLYARVAWGWDCREMILGGRAFRTLAALAGASSKLIARGLPDPAWNHEP